MQIGSYSEYQYQLNFTTSMKFFEDMQESELHKIWGHQEQKYFEDTGSEAHILMCYGLKTN